MRYALALLLLAAAPVSAQGEADLSLETRLLLAALASAEEAAGVYAQALDHLDGTEVGADVAEFLRQRGFEGAIGAAHAQAILEVYATTRAEQSADAEPPLTDEEVELVMLMTELQVIGGDLVALDRCRMDAASFDVAAIREQVAPVLARLRELTSLLGTQVESAGSPEDRP